MVKNNSKKHFLLKILLVFLAAETAAAAFVFSNNPFLKTEVDIVENSEFNPVLLEWEKVSSEIPWEPRDSHALVEYNGKLWLMGGLNANGYVIRPNYVEYWRSPHFSDVWASDDGINWELVTENAAWGKRRSVQAVAFRDKIWLVPGWGPVDGLKKEVWSSEDGLYWKKEVADAPWPAREGHELAVFQDKLWLIGGVDYDSRKTMNDVWYSDDGVNWFRAASDNPWSSRWDHEAVVFQDKLWLIGGMDLKDNVFNDVWYSDDGIDWKLVTDSPPWQARQGSEALVFKDKIWILGRFNDDYNGGVNDIWYSEDGLVWKKTNADPEWLGREDHAAAVFGDKMWLTGGMDKNWTWGNDIWYSTFHSYAGIKPDAEKYYPVKISPWHRLTASIAQSFHPSNKRVEVNIAEQKMRTFEDGELVGEFTVSTGKLDMPTPEGNFSVLSKYVMVYSNLADCWLPFWVGFTSDGLYGFHEVPVCRQGRKGLDDLGKPASIGCVRLGLKDSQAFYDWVDIGTNIKIYNKPAVEKDKSEENIESENPDYSEEKPKWFDELRNWFLNTFK
jgi:hypothetical protein